MLDENAPVLFDLPAAEMPSIRINSRGLRPGVTPPRFAGRPAAVLPSLAVGGGNDKVKSQSAQAPSTRPNHDCVRLWSQMALDQVAANLRAGIVKSEATVVHDTLHYLACSSMQVIDLAELMAAARNPRCTPSRRRHGRNRVLTTVPRLGRQESAEPPALDSPAAVAKKRHPTAGSGESQRLTPINSHCSQPAHPCPTDAIG
jgi:hypothetical protein